MNCLASITDPAAEGAYVARGLRDAAAVCRSDQAALAARLLIAAIVIDELLARLAETISGHDAYVSAAARHAQRLQTQLDIAELAALANRDTILAMHAKVTT